MCNCNIFYIGLDCLYVKLIFLVNLILLENGLCKISKCVCVKINIFGYFWVEIVYVKIRDFEVI